jgi:very-short-patch-repair endonuclease
MGSKPAIADLFARQHGLIRRTQALDHGVGPDAVRHRVRSGQWRRVYRGVYQLAGSPQTFHQRLLAACLAAGHGALVSHRAAAKLWQIPISEELVELTIPERRRISIPGAIVHRTVDLATIRRRWIQNVPVTGLARTVVDLAGVVGEDQLAVLLDHALAERMVSAQTLRRFLSDLERRGRKGAGRLVRLLAERSMESAAPESLFEWRLIRMLRAHGLPRPIAQYRVRLGSGRRARLDFAFPDSLLAVEADSYRHHASLTDWSRDRVRNNELMALGWRVLPVTYRDLVTTPALVANQIERCLNAPIFGG